MRKSCNQQERKNVSPTTGWLWSDDRLPTETVKPKTMGAYLHGLEENSCPSRTVFSEILSFKNDMKLFFKLPNRNWDSLPSTDS